jgi:hypothetical protein
MTPSEFIRNWSRYSELNRFEPSAEVRTTVPALDVAFLMEAGLPSGERIPIPTTGLFRGIPRLEEVYDAPEELNTRGMQLFAFGYFSPASRIRVFHCIEKGTGHLYLVEGVLPTRFEPFFLNTSIHQYAEFLLVAERLFSWQADAAARFAAGEIVDETYAEYELLCDSTVNELRECDPPACAEADDRISGAKWPHEYGIPTYGWSELVVGLVRHNWE